MAMDGVENGSDDEFADHLQLQSAASQLRCGVCQPQFLGLMRNTQLSVIMPLYYFLSLT